MFYDHDLYKGSMESFLIYDHTNYPRTIDPATVSHHQQTYTSREILGIRNELEDQPVMELECVMYWQDTCPLVVEGFDKHVKVQMRSIRLLYL
jgi:hypothetical protein